MRQLPMYRLPPLLAWGLGAVQVSVADVKAMLDCLRMLSDAPIAARFVQEALPGRHGQWAGWRNAGLGTGPCWAASMAC